MREAESREPPAGQEAHETLRTERLKSIKSAGFLHLVLCICGVFNISHIYALDENCLEGEN